MNFKSITQLSEKRLVKGLPKVTTPEMSCDVCLKCKQSKLPFVAEIPRRATTVLQVVSSDICGPLKVPSLGGRRYFISFVDEYTRMTWVYLIKHKSEALDQFKRFKSVAENRCGLKIKILRTDGVESTCRRSLISSVKNMESYGR